MLGLAAAANDEEDWSRAIMEAGREPPRFLGGKGGWWGWCPPGAWGGCDDDPDPRKPLRWGSTGVGLLRSVAAPPGPPPAPAGEGGRIAYVKCVRVVLSGAV